MPPFLNPLSIAAEEECIEKCHKGDRNARHQLIEHNLRLVAHIVKKYNNSSIAGEDLMSAGVIGLCKAIDTYNEKKGNRLVTYASRCIENEILMLLRQERKMTKETSLFEPLGKDKDGNEMNLIDVLEMDGIDPLDNLCHIEQLEQIGIYMQDVLTDYEKELLTLRYGLDGTKAKTQREVGEIFGISRSYVSRMEKKALSKLRKCFI